MPTPKPIEYNEASNKDFQLSINTTNYEFVVVNNPQPQVPFEEQRRFTFPVRHDSTTPSRALVSTKIETINTKYYKVIYQELEDGDHSLPLDNFDDNMTYYDEDIDVSKLSPGALRSKNGGVRLAYMNRFNMALTGITQSTYTYSNGHSFTITTDNTKDYNTLLYDNIPLTPVLARKDAAAADIPEVTQLTDNVSLLLYMPYELIDRFDIDANAEKGNLHKFDYYILAPNETVDTKVFADSTYALVHVAQGSATIGEYELERHNFYEGDATSPITIQAGEEGAIIVLSVNVPSL